MGYRGHVSYCDDLLMSTELDPELDPALAAARRALADALERNAEAEARGGSVPVGAGALIVLQRRVDEAEASLAV
jgi:hypothetical protein